MEPTRHITRAHAIASAFNARFSLSLYYLRRLYLVTSRRWTNDQWLGRSLKQAGQTLFAPSATHVSVVLPFEGESSTAPLTVFLACILYFCHLFPSSFSTVSQHLRRDLGRARLVIGFIAPLGTQVRRLVIFKLLRPVSFYFYMCKKLYPADRARGQRWFHREVRARDSHLVFSPPVLIKINKKKFPQFRPRKVSPT